MSAMTSGVGMREATGRALALAVCGTLFAIPYFYHLVFLGEQAERRPEGLGQWELLLAQLLLLFIICFLSALVGCSFSGRFGLPGLGNGRRLIQHIPILAAAAMLLTAISYLLFDRYFIEISPGSYPSELLLLISIPLKGAFTEEIILRLCLVTLCVGLLRNRFAGVALASLVGAMFTLKYLQFLGIPWEFTNLTLVQLALSFSVNFILGYLYVAEGLAHAVGLKFMLGMKYVALEWWVI